MHVHIQGRDHPNIFHTKGTMNPLQIFFQACVVCISSISSVMLFVSRAGQFHSENFSLGSESPNQKSIIGWLFEKFRATSKNVSGF